MAKLVFMNADATPHNVTVDIAPNSVPDVMAWYGAYFAGDRYTVAMDGRNIPMDQNGEPIGPPVSCHGQDTAPPKPAEP